MKFIWTKKNIKLNKKRGKGRIFFWLVSLELLNARLAKETGVTLHDPLKKNLHVIAKGSVQTTKLKVPNWLQSSEENRSVIKNPGGINLKSKAET